MKKISFLLFLILFGGQIAYASNLPLFLFATNSSNPTNKHVDSLYTLKHVVKVHLAHPDSALRILDFMEQNDLEQPCRIAAYRGLVYSAHKKCRLAVNFGRQALADVILKFTPSEYLQVMSYCADSYFQLSEYENCLQVLDEGLDFARENKNQTAEANFLFMFGQVYALLGDEDLAFNYFNQAVRMGEQAKGKTLKPYLSYFYGQLCVFFMKEGRYHEAMEMCDKRETLLKYLETISGVPLGYIDQQYAYVYSRKALLWAQMGKMVEAEAAYKLFLKTKSSSLPEFHDASCEYDLAMQHFGKVINRLNASLLMSDTLNLSYATDLDWLAQAYHGLGKSGIAYGLLKRREVIVDSVTVRQKREDIAELATLFQLKEKNILIEHQRRQLKYNRMIKLLLCWSLILFAGLFWGLIFYVRKVKYKNRLLAEKINTLYRVEEKCETLEQGLSLYRSSYSSLQPISTHAAELAASQASDDESLSSRPLEKSLSEQESEDDPILFKRLDRAIKDDKLFLNSNFTRQELMDHYAIDKLTLARYLQDFVRMSFSQYLSNLRIRHAVKLIQDSPGLTLQFIAESSGFANLRNFQRSFKLVTGMTPSEYRRIILEKE